MLVLTRKPGETIMLGNDIQVTVVEVKEGQVKLGITAPPEVAIFRREIYDAIQRENQQAALLNAPNALDKLLKGK